MGLVLAMLLITALLCYHDITKTREYEKVVSEKLAIQQYARKQQAELEEITNSMNQVENNLVAIRKEELHIEHIRDDKNSNQNDRITLIIAEMDAYLEENKNLISRMETRLEQAEAANTGLRKLVALQKQAVLEKERKIEVLSQQLASLEEEFKTTVAAKDAVISLKEAEISSRQHALEEKDNTINTAYFLFGDKKLLVDRGVIQSQGNLVWKNLSLTNKFDPHYFEKINMQQTKEIPLGTTNKQKALSSHPADSYYFVKTDGQTYLKIVDPRKFWSVSKYLVIVTES
jgi:hypothetical protein